MKVNGPVPEEKVAVKLYVVPILRPVKVEYSEKKAQVVELIGVQVAGAAAVPKFAPVRLHWAFKAGCERAKAPHKIRNRVKFFISMKK